MSLSEKSTLLRLGLRHKNLVQLHQLQQHQKKRNKNLNPSLNEQLRSRNRARDG
jgi:hypothetical protein